MGKRITKNITKEGECFLLLGGKFKMSGMIDPKILVGTGILVAGVISDLRFRKFHNKLFLVALFVSLLTLFFLGGLSQIWTGLAGAFSALVFCLPLFLMRAIGGGDLKLLVALCFLTTWKGAANILIFSLLWGGLLGLIQIALKGKLKELYWNLVGILNRTPAPKTQLHQIPYTVALLLGWLSYQTLFVIGWGVL